MDWLFWFALGWFAIGVIVGVLASEYRWWLKTSDLFHPRDRG